MPRPDAALARFAKARRTVVGLTGEHDFVRDAERLATIANGHPLMARVTAMGCAASALVGAALAVEPDAWKADGSGADHHRRRWRNRRRPRARAPAASPWKSSMRCTRSTATR